MHPLETFHLSIQFVGDSNSAKSKIKDDVRDWLIGCGEESFVEGVIDDLYMDLDFGANAHDHFDQLGGGAESLSVFRYDLEYLQNLKADLENSFGTKLRCSLDSIDTAGWMEGWKESFKPLRTGLFYVYPPWLSDEVPQDSIPLEIEPGMAFGTGQHATTLLCLEAFEVLKKAGAGQELLDVGTGTGILAIAAKKLGFNRVCATDIDPDSIIATRENAKVNAVEIELQEGSVPNLGQFEVVYANIIFYVLKSLVTELSPVTKSGGFLVLSGLLAEEAREMESIASQNSLMLFHESTREDWACQIYRKI